MSPEARVLKCGQHESHAKFQYDLEDKSGSYDLIIDGTTYKMQVVGEPGSQ